MAANPDLMWIIKPVGASQGIGIKIIGDSAEIKDNDTTGSIAQAYISRPHLINGTKYDLRLYVLVTSWQPLRGYLHEQGLVRFAIALYEEDSRDLAQHLTNSSLHKNSPDYVKNKVCRSTLSSPRICCGPHLFFATTA